MSPPSTLTAGKRAFADDDRVHELHRDVAAVGRPPRRDATTSWLRRQTAARATAPRRQSVGDTGNVAVVHRVLALDGCTA
jgi:hypothetical protein